MATCDLKFHRRIGFPDTLLVPSGQFPVYQTSHSEERSENNKYGEFELPDTVSFSKDEVVEIKIRNRKVWRLLVRKPYNEEFDVCYVIQYPDYELITAWRNEKEDSHDTLDESEYNHPNEFRNYMKQTR